MAVCRTECLTCCPSVPSAVTMATECVPAEEMTASWAGTVMVVPSCVTMVMVLPIACMSAWEMFTCKTQQLLRQGRLWLLLRSQPSFHLPHGWELSVHDLSHALTCLQKIIGLSGIERGSYLIPEPTLPCYSESIPNNSIIDYLCMCLTQRSMGFKAVSPDILLSWWQYKGLEFKPQINKP